MHPPSLTRLPRRRQRGAAALLLTVMLFFAMVLVAMFASRNLVFEQRTSANQYRATQAFEAAEAGVEWALAQLNANRRIGADCRPSADPAANSFRSRYLSAVLSSGALIPRISSNAGAPGALLPSCVRAAEGWSCSCPANGLPTLTPPADNAAAAMAFSVQFLPTTQPGVVRLVANGCTRLAGACLAGSGQRAEATAKIEVAFGLVAGLRTAPVATVTTRGSFDAGTASPGLHNADPATGVAVDAGAIVNAPLARLTPPAGAPTTGLLLGNDAALAGSTTDRFFATYFGVDKAAWATQPAVTRVGCSVDCASVLGAALAATPDAALIQVDGDLALSGPLTLGSAERPVVIVVSGVARLDGAVALRGVLYAASLNWNLASSGAFVRGALFSEAGYQGDGTPELYYDAAVLNALRHSSGSFARVNGSWRDF